jgi:hypothetical protein
MDGKFKDLFDGPLSGLSNKSLDSVFSVPYYLGKETL